MKENKTRIIIAIVIIFLIVFGIFYTLSSVGYDKISYSEFNQMLENEETFVLVVGKDDCSYCDIYEETMVKIIKEYELDIKYINTSKLSKSEYEEFIGKLDKDISGTPTTVFIENGAETTYRNRIDGAKSESTVIDSLTAKGYIEE